MRKTVLGFFRLFIGFFVVALGMVMTINASIGLAPWDVLHEGISKISGLTIGRANIIIGILIILIDIFLGANIGWGTLFNMVFIGLFVDFVMFNNLIPIFNSFFPSLAMMLLGMLVLGYGVFIYIGAGYGAGPRDGLMVALHQKTNKSIRFVKNSVELFALILGYVLGGSVGVGTVIMAVGGGYFFQFAFKTVNFDISAVEHRYIKDDIKFIKGKMEKTKQRDRA